LTTYKDSGVDINEGYKAVEKIKKMAKETFDSNVVTDIGLFGSAYSLNKWGFNYYLVSGTDGVGTKLKIAFYLDIHNTVGIDCVAMCVNDVACLGAKPLFFLDYIACGKLKSEKIASIVEGIAKGCKVADCSLIGGETAEMPNFYQENEYDIAGFCVGIVHKDKIINGNGIKEGDIIIGIESNGVHSNGYSLVRKVFDIDNNPKVLNKYFEDLSITLGEELLKPTHIYVKEIIELSELIRINGISHITGGGFYENIPRILPEKLSALIDKNAWSKPIIFELIMKYGDVQEKEMFSTFNMGIGMILVIDKNHYTKAMEYFKKTNLKAHVIGEIISGNKEVILK